VHFIPYGIPTDILISPSYPPLLGKKRKAIHGTPGPSAGNPPRRAFGRSQGKPKTLEALTAEDAEGAKKTQETPEA